MSTIAVTDLDGTVLFSDRALAATPAPDQVTGELVAIDEYEGRTCGYMTRHAVELWTRLADAGAVVPATTRSAAQYRRLRLPGPAPRFAVVANGSQILVDGATDLDWRDRVQRTMARAVAPFAEVWAQAQQWGDRGTFRAIRHVDEVFVYLVANRRAPWLEALAAEAEAWALDRGWRASLQGRKLYLMPSTVDKAAAVTEVADRLGASRIVAGGDSLLDVGMLKVADAAIRPAHGELHVQDFQAPNCRVTEIGGAAAGDEIMSWYAAEALPKAA